MAKYPHQLVRLEVLVSRCSCKNGFDRLGIPRLCCIMKGTAKENALIVIYIKKDLENLWQLLQNRGGRLASLQVSSRQQIAVCIAHCQIHVAAAPAGMTLLNQSKFRFEFKISNLRIPTEPWQEAQKLWGHEDDAGMPNVDEDRLNNFQQTRSR